VVMGQPYYRVADPARPGFSHHGAAYVFAKDAVGNYYQEAKLLSDQSWVSGYGMFGKSVALDKDVLLVGENEFSALEDSSGGSVTVFRRRNGSWLRESKLFPSAERYDESPRLFGHSAAIEGGRVLVGMSGANGSPIAGKAFAYSCAGTTEICQPTAAAPALVEMAETGWIDTFHQLESGDLEVVLNRNYVNPVVILGTPMLNTWWGVYASQPNFDVTKAISVRVTSKSSDRFRAKVVRAKNLPYLDEYAFSGSKPRVPYMVIEAGRYRLPNGTLLEAGLLTSSATVSNSITGTWATRSMTSGFSSAPVVLTQVQSFNQPDFLKTRIRNVGGTSFQVAMEEDESNTTSHGSETIGYLAIQAKTGDWFGHRFQATITGQTVTNVSGTHSFSPAMGTRPLFFGALATYADKDNAFLRMRSFSRDRIGLIAQEDTVKDTEVTHGAERANFLAVEAAGIMHATKR